MAVLIVARAYQHLVIYGPPASGYANCASLVTGHRCRQRRVCKELKGPCPILAKYGHFPSFPTAHDQSLVSVTVKVEPAYPRSSPAESSWQQRLSDEIVKWILVMHVMNGGADVLKEGLRRGCDGMPSRSRL